LIGARFTPPCGKKRKAVISHCFSGILLQRGCRHTKKSEKKLKKGVF
jgi:hypothetical protein